MPLLLRRRLLGLTLASPLVLAGCGFRLRGSFDAPFRTIYLQMRENTRFSSHLKRALESGSSMKVVSSPEEAEAIFELLGMTRSRDVLSYNDRGDAREYEIMLKIHFRVVAPHDGFEFVEPTIFSSKGDISYTESEFLSRDSEEEVLYKRMEEDLIHHVVRRLEAARRPG